MNSNVDSREQTLISMYKHCLTLYTSKISWMWVLVSPICNSSFLGGWDQKDCGLRPASTNSLWEPHLQNKQSKMDWRCGSSGKSPTLQVQTPELKLQYQYKKS
jgi:hypothetical protein